MMSTSSSVYSISISMGPAVFNFQTFMIKKLKKGAICKLSFIVTTNL